MYGKGRAIGWGAEGANLVEFGELGGWSGVRFGGLIGRGAELAGVERGKGGEKSFNAEVAEITQRCGGGNEDREEEGDRVKMGEDCLDSSGVASLYAWHQGSLIGWRLTF